MAIPAAAAAAYRAAAQIATTQAAPSAIVPANVQGGNFSDFLSGAIKDSVNVLSMANNTGATVFAQYGALAALSPEGDAFREKIRERCHHGREVTQKFIDTQNRIRWMKPEGAFYGFLNVEGMTNSHDFAIELIKKAGVGVAPGTAFGDVGDSTLESYVRICFAQDPKLLETGLERLGKAVSAL